jgi:hypothetical protein
VKEVKKTILKPKNPKGFKEESVGPNFHQFFTVKYNSMISFKHKHKPMKFSHLNPSAPFGFTARTANPTCKQFAN